MFFDKTIVREYFLHNHGVYFRGNNMMENMEHLQLCSHINTKNNTRLRVQLRFILILFLLQILRTALSLELASNA